MSETQSRIKICGITNREDALLAVDLGAHALGFIFVPGTPRYVGSHPGALETLAELPPFVTTVAVCATLTDAADPRTFACSAVQYYAPGEDGAPHAEMRSRVRAVRVRGPEALEEIAALVEAERPRALLLDAWHKDTLGGSGETFNWEIAAEAKERFGLPVILAGGLTPENVGEAVRAVRPYAVDVSSGVEASPGRKDPEKIRAFFHAVNSASE
jgi:phosphoribosylanthranilate isomerase